MIQTFLSIQVNVYTVLICLILFLQVRKQREDVVGKKTFGVILFSTGIVALLNAVSWLLEGTDFTGAHFIYHILLMLHFIFQIIPTVYMLIYCIESNNTIQNIKRDQLISAVVVGIWTLFLVSNQIHPWFYVLPQNNVYTRLPAFWVISMLPLLMNINSIVLCIYNYIKYKAQRKVYKHLVIFLLFSIPGILIQTLFYGIETVWMFVALGLIYLYVNVQREREQELELIMMGQRMKMMLSQIQPHFLYNCLASIETLCDIDAETAKEGIYRFSKYLRGNLDSLAMEELIRFEQELNHIKNYVELEKMQYGDDLQMKYDLEVTDFIVPSLTIQPLVENAIRYGVGKKEEGGTVILKTRETGNEITIEIIDDGAGFDPNVPKKDDRTHIGIRNARMRIKERMGGYMTVESKLNEGTHVTIQLPKGVDRK